MIYLIGVNHGIQRHGRNADSALIELRTEFKKYLQKMAKQLKITLIAEEYNQEELDKYKDDYTYGQEVAKDLEIEHRFCDPNTLERKALGIELRKEIMNRLGITEHVMPKTGVRFLNSNESEKIDGEARKYFPKRERFWLDKIKDKANEPIIFICGYSHVDSFESLLIGEGYKTEVLSKRWEKESPSTFC